MDLRTFLNSAPRGTSVAIAKAIGVSPVMVTQWANGDKPTPWVRCPAIELATDGQVTAEELCSDVVWQRVKDRDWPHPKGRPCIDVASSAMEA